MEGWGDVIKSMLEAGTPIWIIVSLVIFFIIARYGPKWLGTILSYRNDKRIIIANNEMENERLQMQISDKFIEQEERLKALETNRAENHSDREIE